MPDPSLPSSDPSLATGPAIADASPGGPDERRAATRHPANRLPWIETVRVANVEDARLINISSTGVLMQCRARLVPGSETVLQIVGPKNRFRLKGKVVRCEVADVRQGGTLQYEVAVAFDPDPCPLPVAQHLSTNWV